MSFRLTIGACVIVCVAAIAGCSSPSEPSGGLEGSWTGTLFQPQNENGNTMFPYSLQLTVSGTLVTGTAHAERLNLSQYYADYAITGSFVGDTLTLRETSITRQNPPPGGFWCIKTETLHYTASPRSLTGPWDSTNCVNTGTIELH